MKKYIQVSATPTDQVFGPTGNTLPMIETLKSDELVQKIGGKFRLTALIQRRMEQLMDGARPLVERRGRTDLELVVEEIRQDKISAELLFDIPTEPEETL